MAVARIAKRINRSSALPQDCGTWRERWGERWAPFLRGRFAALGAAALLLIIFLVYRILTFIPRPFDGPRTLRPLLYACFDRFVKHYPGPEQAQLAWGTYCIVALFVPPALAFWNYFYGRPHPQSVIQKILSSKLTLFAGIGVSLFVCRFPFLLANQINPDETFFIAAAEKLFRDPVFFRAVDFVTSGPFNVYPLMLPAALGISPDYVSTRLIALAIIFASIYIIYRTLALVTDDPSARIAILPAAGAFAVLKYGDFLHYSSEHVSFLLLALGFYVCVKTFLRPQSHAWKVAALGLLTAVAFLAKMQAVPILGCIGAVAIAYIHCSGHATRWWRPSFLFALGLAPLLLLNAIVCIWVGVWHDFWMEYIIGNYYYVEAHGPLILEAQRFVDHALSIVEIRMLVTGLLAVLAAYVYQRARGKAADQTLFLETAAVGGVTALAASWILHDAGGALVSYAVLMAMLLLAGSFILLIRQNDPSPVRWLGFLSAAVVAISAAVTYVPHRTYGHYLLLLIFPISIAMAWTVVKAAEVTGSGRDGDILQRRHASAPFLLVFGVLTLAGQLFELGSQDFIAFSALPPTVHAPESETIEALTPPGGQITVWGWDARPYVGSGRVSALKDLFAAQLFLTSGKVREYYRAGYLNGLRGHRPELFIDAIDTSHGGYANRKAYGLELTPEINSFVQSSYVRVLDAFSQRYYVRRDLAASVAGIGEARSCDLHALRCFQGGGADLIPTTLPPVQMPQHALLEVTFTPETRQELYATVFSNEARLPTHQGFQLLHYENDRYRLAIGTGTEWALSKELSLPQRKPVSLAVEFAGDVITIVCNGTKIDEMHLSKPIVDSAAPITIGSWIDKQRPFRGNIQFFQIRDLGRER